MMSYDSKAPTPGAPNERPPAAEALTIGGSRRDAAQPRRTDGAELIETLTDDTNVLAVIDAYFEALESD